MASLSLVGLRKSFDGRPVVRDLTLDVDDGELFVLVGPSGCGKTTTLRLIAGLEAPDGGTIVLDDRDVTKLRPAERDIAMVFQSYALFPHMTVFDNLAFGLSARGRPSQEINERVLAVAMRLDLEPYLQRKSRQLSGGERQRVALGRAIVREPAVFLMDEPLSNLDAQLRTQTRGEIVALQERLRTTTVYVTHDQVEALAMGHRMGVLRDGALEQVGQPQEIYDKPATLFVAGFIGSPAMNLFPASLEGDTLAGGGIRVAAGKRSPKQVVIGVRPEHVHVAGSSWSGAPRSTPFTATITRFESLGDQSILSLDADAAVLRARVEPDFSFRRGEATQVWIDAAKVHVFDAETGRRV